MIAEQEHRLRVDDLFISANLLVPKDRRHGSNVLVTEPDVRAHETFVTWANIWNADRIAREIGHPMPCQDLLAEIHGPGGRRDRRHTLRAFAPCDVVLEQSAVLDDPASDFTFAVREHTQRNLFAVAQAVDEREIRAREDAEVLTVLPIDALDTLRDHQPDPGAPLGVG